MVSHISIYPKFDPKNVVYLNFYGHSNHRITSSYRDLGKILFLSLNLKSDPTFLVDEKNIKTILKTLRFTTQLLLITVY